MPKNIRLTSTHYFIMKVLNKREPQHIEFNHLSDVDFKEFMNLSKKVLQNHIVTDTTLASDNPLSFRKNILERI